MDVFRTENNCLKFHYDAEELWIQPWGANSFRIRATKLAEMPKENWALEMPVEDIVPKIQIEEKRASIINGKIKAVISSYGKLTIYNSKDEILLDEYLRNRLDVFADYCSALDIEAREFKPILGGDYHLSMRFVSNPEEKIYGMGQYQQPYLNLKGTDLELAQRNSQASVPFVLSSLGYGFLWHNPAIGQVTFGKNVTDWYAASTRQMDYWITAGDTPDEIEQAYGRAVGTTPMMPEYGLGFWQCKLRYWNQEQLLQTAREYHRRGIPLDVIVCDFFHWPRMGDFRFDEEFFPDPEGMVRSLKEMGVELMVSVWPEVACTRENYEEMKQKGFLVKAEKGIDLAKLFNENSTFTDVTNPDARDYLWEKCRQNYYEKGIRLFWLDEAEPGFTVYDYDNYRCRMGTQAQVGNLYPQLFTRTFYEGLRRAGEEQTVSLVRCAWAGSQRYGALVWSGDIHSDWQTFRRQVCAGLNMGIAGIPWWTTDIGGFSGGNPEDEAFRRLLVRWFEWGTFCPVMRLHGDRTPSETVVNKAGEIMQPTGADNEVWSFGEENCNTLVKYIQFREAMRPYTRKLMEEAHTLGRPVMRPMFYEFPDQKCCWDMKEQYMYGSDMLVAPVLYEDSYEREVYLPEGSKWTSVHDGSVYEGGQTIQVQAALDVIPVFLRDDKLPELKGLI